MTDSLQPHLSIPENLERMSILDAALAYARCGWYVLPINSRTKNPGSLLGTNWPEQSTKDPDQIRRIFKFPETAIALHVGKSGAIAFDVDDPTHLGSLLEKELLRGEVPFQSTRLIGDGRRGHYLFSIPLGVSYGNSVGGLGKGWGDVRGQNGVIVASPSSHEKEFGHYQWKRTGPLPLLPASLAVHLPVRSGDSVGRLTLQEGQAFISANNGKSYQELLPWRLGYIRENPPTVNGRHTAMQRFLCLILKDSVVGFYPASDALNQAHAFFNSIKTPSEQTPREFENMVYWAMAQVEAMTDGDKALHAFSCAPHSEEQILSWARSNGK